MPAAIGGSSGGSAIAELGKQRPSEASAGNGEGANASGSDWGARLISAFAPSARQMRSGSQPMME